LGEASNHQADYGVLIKARVQRIFELDVVTEDQQIEKLLIGSLPQFAD
jgi:hypothetical protein